MQNKGSFVEVVFSILLAFTLLVSIEQPEFFMLASIVLFRDLIGLKEIASKECDVIWWWKVLNEWLTLLACALCLSMLTEDVRGLFEKYDSLIRLGIMSVEISNALERVVCRVLSNKGNETH